MRTNAPLCYYSWLGSGHMGDYRHFNNQHFRICRFRDVWRNINVHPFRHLSTIFINGDKIQSMTKIARKCQWLAIMVWKSVTILVINRIIHPSFHYNPSQNNKYNKTAESWPSNFELFGVFKFRDFNGWLPRPSNLSKFRLEASKKLDRYPEEMQICQFKRRCAYFLTDKPFNVPCIF